jgi:Family of unknown function (DUF6113)
MGTSQGPRATGGQRTVTIAGYVMLFVLGALQGMIGSFHYSQSPTPLIAILLVVIIFLTCAGAGWGVGTFGAGLLPGVGWILASFIISMPRPNGSVVITASAAGEWYLYGGAIACVAGCLATFFIRVRRSVRPR